MANPKHLEWLKESCQIIDNEYYPEASGRILTGLDLEHADLKRVKLFRPNIPRSNFFKADLSGSELPWANLYDANLERVNFSGTDLSWANLSMANLKWADMRSTKLYGANLSGADLHCADLSGTNLENANLSGAYLPWSNLSMSNLTKAEISGSDLTWADMHCTNLKKADLSRTLIVNADLRGADLTGARIYGISVWDVKTDEKTIQKDMIITRAGRPEITVDDLDVAQFIYILTNNDKLRNVIDKITSKVVLILGNFSEERKKILDAIRDRIRDLGKGYIPVMFDFPAPENKDFTDTVKLLGHMARFIIADLSHQKSIPHELSMIAPYTVAPILPLFEVSTNKDGDKSDTYYSMFDDFVRRYDWVLPVHGYKEIGSLLEAAPQLVDLAENKARKWRRSGPCMPEIQCMAVDKDMQLTSISLENNGKTISLEFEGSPIHVSADSNISGSAEIAENGIWQAQLLVNKPDGSAELVTRRAKQREDQHAC